MAITTIEAKIGIATVILGVASVEETKEESCPGGLSHQRGTRKESEKASCNIFYGSER
jgi:hypothetical protein